MDRSEYAGMEGSVVNQAPEKGFIHSRSVFGIRIAGFLGKGIGIQPVLQQKVHAQPPLGILRRVNMKIREGGKDHAAAVVCQRGILFRQLPVNSFHCAVFHSDIAAPAGNQLIPAAGVYKIRVKDPHLQPFLLIVRRIPVLRGTLYPSA